LIFGYKYREQGSLLPYVASSHIHLLMNFLRHVVTHFWTPNYQRSVDNLGAARLGCRAEPAQDLCWATSPRTRNPCSWLMTGATPVWDPHFIEILRGLVLGCIDSYDSESRRIFSHFSRSTRFACLCTAPDSKYQVNISCFSSKV